MHAKLRSIERLPEGINYLTVAIFKWISIYWYIIIALGGVSKLFGKVNVILTWGGGGGGVQARDVFRCTDRKNGVRTSISMT